MFAAAALTRHSFRRNAGQTIVCHHFMWMCVICLVVSPCLGRIPIAAVGPSGAAGAGSDAIGGRQRLCAHRCDRAAIPSALPQRLHVQRLHAQAVAAGRRMVERLPILVMCRYRHQKSYVILTIIIDGQSATRHVTWANCSVSCFFAIYLSVRCLDADVGARACDQKAKSSARRVPAMANTLLVDVNAISAIMDTAVNLRTSA